jgi:hypothetical protein
LTRALDAAFISWQVRIECPLSPHLPQLRVVFEFATSVPFADFLSLRRAPRITGNGGVLMHYQVDLDPKHAVIRLTVIEEMVSLECAESCYQGLSRATSTGGPYAAIYDLTRAKDTTIPTEIVRGFARRSPSIPTGSPHVVVGKFPVIYGLARLFQMCGESVGKEFEVVHTLEEAYEIVGARPEDFTVCLLPERLAA